MATLSSPSRHDHLVGTLKRAPAPRASTRYDRGAPRHDAVLLGTASFYGDGVYDVAGKFLGEIEELVIDIHSGRVAYGLMAVGGILGMGSELFAIPWNAVTVDRVYQRCVVNIDIVRLIDAPSVDGDFLARMADPGWATQVHAYFGCKPYWE